MSCGSSRLDISETVYQGVVERSTGQIEDLRHFPGPRVLGMLELQASGGRQGKDSQLTC